MIFSIYSFIMGIFWFNILTIIIFILIRNKYFTKIINIKFLTECIFCCFIRILLPIDLPFVKILRSDTIYPFMYSQLNNMLILSKLSLFELLIIFILFVSIFLFLYHTIKYIKFKKYIFSRKSNVSGRAKKIYFNILKDFKTQKSPMLIQNSNIIVPFHIGFFKPIIALPNYNFSEEELYYIIKHEFLHYYNGDIWIKWLSVFLLSLFWWNPFTYIFTNDLEQILEIRCDMKVCESMPEAKRLEYVQTILKTVEKKVKKENMTIYYTNNIIKNHKSIKQRFNIILYSIVPKCKKSIAIVAIPILILIISYIFIIQPYYSPTVKPLRNDSIILSSKNSYIKCENGKYSLYVNGKFFNIVKEDKIENFRLIGVPIKGYK